MSTYTEGNWGLIKWGDKFKVEAVQRTPGLPIVREVAIAGREIDARLIVAAPAMFEALCELIEKSEDSDDFQYGTLSTTFVREIAKNAIVGIKP